MKTLRLTSVAFVFLFLPSLAFPAPQPPAVPRPEHPRPDAYRQNWLSLNGRWQFEIDDSGDGESRGLTSGKNLASSITVPFCPESKLSGVGHYGLMKHTWYRRKFTLPAMMRGKHVRLHFEAVDYQARVWLNGSLAGSHTGGSVPFLLDITKLLRDGENELVVNVSHDVPGGDEPVGKQTPTVSQGCVYTRTTGIWQTVWLEAVGDSFVEDVNVTTDPEQSRVIVDAYVNNPEPGLTLTAEAFADGKSVGADSCPVTGREHHLVVNLSRKQLWEPGAPFLYDLKFSITRYTLARGAETVDELSSYFGLRTVSIQGRALLINGKRVFQRLILDQGFYPDGIWTAPSDQDLRADIQRAMDAGFNGARLHQKVFEPRYLYWADRLGYMVWGEFPNWGFNYKPRNYPAFIDEWRQALIRDRNHPSIIGWCPFNETPPESAELEKIIFGETRRLDPSRPVLDSSGWQHVVDDPEISDAHDYNQSPQEFKKRWDDFFNKGEAKWRPFMVSEFGGIGWATDGGWGYGNGPKSLQEFYTRYDGLVSALLDNPNVFGFCYTQLTDVEQEHNGLYYYDRRPKFDLQRLHAITARPAAYEVTGPTAQ